MIEPTMVSDNAVAFLEKLKILFLEKMKRKYLAPVLHFFGCFLLNT